MSLYTCPYCERQIVVKKKNIINYSQIIGGHLGHCLKRRNKSVMSTLFDSGHWEWDSDYKTDPVIYPLFLFAERQFPLKGRK